MYSCHTYYLYIYVPIGLFVFNSYFLYTFLTIKNKIININIIVNNNYANDLFDKNAII